jgi:outer membrane protein TolC
MTNLRKMKFVLSIAAASLFFTGCTIAPKLMTPEVQRVTLEKDRIRATQDVQPLGTILTMNEAIARGLKYNLDHRSKMLEQAIAMGTFDLSKWDMMPKVLANAGYNYRNNSFITNSTNSRTGEPSLSDPSISSDRTYGTAGVNLSWSLLDFGVSYFNARQNSDRIVVASERRRRTMHILVQDVQSAYLRASAAQKLSDDIGATIYGGNRAIENSLEATRRGLKEPEDALKYQKALLDNIKILETIDQELSTAKIELFQLINLPPNTKILLEDPDTLPVPNPFNDVAIQEFEIRALIANADLKESIYNTRIAHEETRKSLLRLFPGLTFNVGPQTSNNSYYINKNWVEGAANISYNLWNILLAPDAIKLAEQNESLAEQKRMMMQMAVVSQVYLSKLQLSNSHKLYTRSAGINEVDSRLAKITAYKFKAGAASDAEKVAADASSIVSKLRNYQALSQLFAASGKMQATTGLEPHFDSVDDISLEEMTIKVRDLFNSWNTGVLPALPPELFATENPTAIPTSKSDSVPMIVLAETPTALTDVIVEKEEKSDANAEAKTPAEKTNNKKQNTTNGL